MASRSSSSATTGGSASQAYVGGTLFGSITSPSRGWILLKKTEKHGRNARCACGSGKKHKHCHGKPREPSWLLRLALRIQTWLQ
jgi:hypothetical protein